MADELTVEQIYEKAFQLVDKDGDGKIKPHEMEDVMRSLGQNPTKAEIETMISQVNGAGTVDFPVFWQLMTVRIQETSSEVKALEAFELYDTDKDGFISAHEIRVAMEKLGQMITDEEAVAMIEEADLDGDGKLNFEEFAKAMK